MISQKSKTQRQQSTATPCRQETEEPDADKALRQHMQQEAPQELLRSESHFSLLIAVRVIPPAKRDLTVGYV